MEAVENIWSIFALYSTTIIFAESHIVLHSCVAVYLLSESSKHERMSILDSSGSSKEYLNCYVFYIYLYALGIYLNLDVFLTTTLLLL